MLRATRAARAKSLSGLRPPVLEMSASGGHQGTPRYTVHILPAIWAGSKGVVSAVGPMDRTQTGPNPENKYRN